MKVLVTGSRKTNKEEKAYVISVLNEIQPTVIVEGGATGVDSVARTWGGLHKVPTYTHRAKWTAYGKAAGHIRNAEMLEKHPDIDLVVAFPRESSRGTIDMINKAEIKGVPVRIFPIGVDIL